MKIKKCAINKLSFIAFLLANVFCHNATASEIKISWSGKVLSIVEFKANAIPAVISVGDQITGTLRFDQSAYDKSTDILGNMSYGNNYYYLSGLKQSIYIGQWNWVLDSGKIQLSSFYNTDNKYFDVFSSSNSLYNFSYIEFPNYVGEFELGFALKDDKLPLNIFDIYSLPMANFDFNEVTWGEGFITSREWDSNNDIVDGYYITFEISEVTIENVANAPPIVTGKTPTGDTTPTWNWSSSGGGNGNYRYRLANGTWTKTKATSFAPSTALPAGQHTLYVQESDAAGNWSVSGKKNIVIDLAPPNAPSVNGKTPTRDTTPTWSWSRSGGGNGNYRYRLDNGTWKKTRARSFTPPKALPVGQHTLYVQESDAAGNWSVSGKKNIGIKVR